MAIFEEKFFVVNLKHIKRLPILLQDDAWEALDYIDRHTPDNEYYVCNQDEPYANEVLWIILRGEGIKETKRLIALIGEK